MLPYPHNLKKKEEKVVFKKGQKSEVNKGPIFLNI